MELNLSKLEDFIEFLRMFSDVLRRVNEKWDSIIRVFTSEEFLDEILRTYYNIEEVIDRNSISFRIIQDIKLNFTPEQIIESISRRFPNLKEMIYNIRRDDFEDFLKRLLFVDLNPFIKNLLSEFQRALLQNGIAEKIENGILIHKDALAQFFGVDIPEDIVLIF